MMKLVIAVLILMAVRGRRSLHKKSMYLIKEMVCLYNLTYIYSDKHMF